jgi:hypothetical protein
LQSAGQILEHTEINDLMTISMNGSSLEESHAKRYFHAEELRCMTSTCTQSDEAATNKGEIGPVYTVLVRPIIVSSLNAVSGFLASLSLRFHSIKI